MRNAIWLTYLKKKKGLNIQILPLPNLILVLFSGICFCYRWWWQTPRPLIVVENLGKSFFFYQFKWLFAEKPVWVMQHHAANRRCTGRLSNLSPTPGKGVFGQVVIITSTAAAKSFRRKKDGGWKIGACLLFIPLGPTWTGCRSMARDGPHVLSCVNRGQFSRWCFLFRHRSPFRPQRAAPLFRGHHPEALPHFFEQPQQETIHSAACRSARERHKNSKLHLFFILWQNQPQLIPAPMIPEPGYLSQPLSGSTRSNANTQPRAVGICLIKGNLLYWEIEFLVVISWGLHLVEKHNHLK